MEFFASSKIHSAFGRIARRATRDEYTHAGVKLDTVRTFEQRLKCGFYRWAEYQDPDYRWVTVGVNASPTRIKRAYDEVEREWLGKRYGVGQLIGIAGVVAWSLIGVDKRKSFGRRLVCSEVVWRIMDGLGGSIQSALNGEFPRRDQFRPQHQIEFWEKHPRWFPITGRQDAA